MHNIEIQGFACSDDTVRLQVWCCTCDRALVSTDTAITELTAAQVLVIAAEHETDRSDLRSSPQVSHIGHLREIVH